MIIPNIWKVIKHVPNHPELGYGISPLHPMMLGEFP
jgi:hypothetical protein